MLINKPLPFEGHEVEAESVQDFCKRYYKPDRYTERGEEYVQAVLASQQKDLEQFGYTLISHHDSRTGEAVVWRGPSQRLFYRIELLTNEEPVVVFQSHKARWEAVKSGLKLLENEYSHCRELGRVRPLSALETRLLVNGWNPVNMTNEEMQEKLAKIMEAKDMPDKYYSRPIEKPKTAQQGIMNFVQMIINNLEAGETRAALLQAVDLLEDLRTEIYQVTIDRSPAPAMINTMGINKR